MVQDTPSRKLDKIVIRVPDGLRDRIAAKAKENSRSVNAELVDLLERAYPQLTPTPDLYRRAKWILDRVGKHLDEPLNDGVRWSLVSLINNADEHGVLESDTGIADMIRNDELVADQEIRRRKLREKD